MTPEPNEPTTPPEARDSGGEAERRTPRSAIDDLLRSPSELARRGCGSEGRRLWLQLLLVALACFVAYGATAGLFRSGEQALVAGVKTPLIAFGSLLLCLPSLYEIRQVFLPRRALPDAPHDSKLEQGTHEPHH
jgi:hypothetical protein